MRFVYLDETGTGNIDVEPLTAVAGVIVDADKQWRVLEQYLKDMADDFALPEHRNSFVFHAQELMHGGKTVSREKYPRERRLFFLRSLCEIPGKFKLPVSFHSVDRRALLTKNPKLNHSELLEQALLHASISCAHGVERFMRRFADENEVAMLVYEKNGKNSKAIREYHNLFRSNHMGQYVVDNPMTKLVQFDRIVDTAHFADKTDTSILQVADCCAYMLGRLTRHKGDSIELTSPLLRQLIFGPRELMEKADLIRTTL